MQTIDSEKLLRVLQQRGMSRRRLARELDVSRTTVTRILSKQNNPSHDVANRIAEVLNLSEQECLEIFFPRYSMNERTILCKPV